MSLADIVPLVIEIDFKPRRLSGKESKAASQARWLAKNRDAFNKYRRNWRAKRRA